MTVWLLAIVLIVGSVGVWLLYLLLDDRPSRPPLSRSDQIELAERIRATFVKQFGIDDPAGLGGIPGESVGAPGDESAESGGDLPAIDAVAATVGNLFICVEVGPAGVEARVEPEAPEDAFGGIPESVTVHLAPDGYEYDQVNKYAEEPPWTRVHRGIYLSGDGPHRLPEWVLEILDRQWPTRRPDGWARCTLERQRLLATSDSRAPGYNFDFADIGAAAEATIDFVRIARAIGRELLPNRAP